MKKKFITFALSLMLIVSSAFIFGACGEKPVPVAEAAAMETFNEAITQMEDEEAIKMYCNLMGYEMIMITSEDATYTYATDSMEIWMHKNDDHYVSHSITSYSFDGEEPEFEYIKSIIPAIEMDSDSTFDDLLGGALDGELDDSFELEFASASKLDGVLTVKFDLMELEDPIFTISFDIKNNKITSMSMNIMGFSIKYKISYGAHLLEQIPAIPTLDANSQPIVWEEYEPKIEVEGMPTVFEIGDSLNLEDVTVEFYEDLSDYWPFEEYDLTMDMISGFDTTTATEIGHPRTMTIKIGRAHV